MGILATFQLISFVSSGVNDTHRFIAFWMAAYAAGLCASIAFWGPKYTMRTSRLILGLVIFLLTAGVLTALGVALNVSRHAVDHGAIIFTLVSLPIVLLVTVRMREASAGGD
jgi:hypothetical protein